MGRYINIGNADFQSVRKDEYIDKSKIHTCQIEKISHRIGGQSLSQLLSQLLSQSTNWDKLTQTFLMLQQPCKLKDVRAMLKVSGATYFKKNYIDPLVAEGYVAMTIPDKPNSRLQMYYLTEKGLSLLKK